MDSRETKGNERWERTACCLLSPLFIKPGFNASPLPLLIKLLEQWLMIVCEASGEWRWGQEQKRWTWVSGRESGLSHSASELLAAALPGLRVAPALVPPTHQPAGCPLPQGPQVDLNGGGRAMEGGGVAASKSQTFLVSSCCSPTPATCTFRYHPLFSISSAQSPLEGSPTPSVPASRHAAASPHPGFHASLVAAPWWQSSSHCTGLKANVQSRDAPSCGTLWKLPITPSFKSPPLAFVANLFLFLFFFLIILYWSTVDLQCCVSFRCIAKWFSYTYAYIHSFPDSFPI